MKLITRDTDYAVRALCYIAQRKKRLLSVRELVEALKIPRPFLRKILQILNQNKILKSHKGSGGGFELRKKPAKIFLLELIEIFQGPLKLNECFLKKAPCPNVRICKLKNKVENIQKYITAQLKEITLACLLKGEQQ